MVTVDCAVKKILIYNNYNTDIPRNSLLLGLTWPSLSMYSIVVLPVLSKPVNTSFAGLFHTPAQNTYCCIMHMTCLSYQGKS